MKFNFRMMLAFATIVAVGFQQSSAQEEDLPTGESILMKYVENTGGVEKYKSVKNVRIKGTMSVPAQGISGTVDITTVVPDKMAAKVEIEGIGTIENGSNGEATWENSAMMGPRLITGKEADIAKEQSNMERIYNPAKYYKSMKTVGTEEVDGKKCYKVELITKSDDKIQSFYDVESGLELKSIRTIPSQMGPLKVHSYSSDYQEDDGIKTPHKVEQKLDTGMVLQVISMDEVNYNVEIPADAFNPPAAVKKLMDKKAEKDAEEKAEKETAGSDK